MVQFLKIQIFLIGFILSFPFGSSASRVQNLQDGYNAALTFGDVLKKVQNQHYQAKTQCGGCLDVDLTSNDNLSVEQLSSKQPLCRTIGTLASYDNKTCADVLNNVEICKKEESSETIHYAVSPKKVQEWKEIFSSVYNMGTSDCYCCANPSLCLGGQNVSQVMGVLRGVGYAGGVATVFSIQKHCDTMSKVQATASAMDATAAGNCGVKAGRCSSQFQECISAMEGLLDKSSKAIEALGACGVGAFSEFTNDTVKLVNENVIESWKKKFTEGLTKCESIKGAAVTQGFQSFTNLLASAISKECADDYKDDKKKKEDDNESPCSFKNINSNAQKCKNHCIKTPDDPQCTDYCKKYEDEDVCPAVCEHFPAHSANCGAIACQDRKSASCKSYCQSHVTESICRASSNCVINRDAEGCEDPDLLDDDVDCEVDTENPLCVGKTELSSGGDPPPPPGDPDCDDPLGCDGGLPNFTPPPPPGDPTSTGSSKYPGTGGSSGGGGLPAGSGTGGSGAANGEEEMEGQEEEYENILAGLSPQDDRGSGGSYRYSSGGGSSKKSGGFDLSKFLPKKKKDAKVAINPQAKISGPEDNIFDTLSSTVRAYCGANNLECNPNP